jgi:hypothetical protein
MSRKQYQQKAELFNVKVKLDRPSGLQEILGLKNF